ncbi:MAG: hypothetical protein P0S94_02090 [Simkaniaceae bacterium]|nr:hypothetical protein [Simkaniaceae bacterium]
MSVSSATAPLYYGGMIDLGKKESDDVTIQLVTLGLFQRIARFFNQFCSNDSYRHTRFSHHKDLFDTHQSVQDKVKDLLQGPRDDLFHELSRFSTRLNWIDPTQYPTLFRG